MCNDYPDLICLLEKRGRVMMVKEGLDGNEIAAKKDDSGHILIVSKQPHVFYYTLAYSDGDSFSDGLIRFNGDSAVFGKEGASGWEYRKVK